jgi:hypothetical protein
MTTFESSVTIFAVTAIVFILVIGMVTIVNKLKEIIDKQDANWEQLRKIETHTNFLADISQQLDNIENSNDQDFEKLTDIVDKMHRNLCVEIADKVVDKVHPPTYVTPCYAPNGICTNPQMDCINCPKRGTGGTWSTSTNTIKED